MATYETLLCENCNILSDAVPNKLLQLKNT
jgi:hypothetical protein